MDVLSELGRLFQRKQSETEATINSDNSSPVRVDAGRYIAAKTSGRIGIGEMATEKRERIRTPMRSKTIS